MIRLSEIDDLKTELKESPDAVFARAAEGISEAQASLAAAQLTLAQEREKKATGYRILAERRQELDVILVAAVNSRTLALEGDHPPVWREFFKNRQRKEELQMLIQYQEKVVGSTNAVLCKQAEAQIACKQADLWESQAVLERCKLFVAAEAARRISGGVKLDATDSRSSALLERAEHIRRSVIPSLEKELIVLVERMESARAEMNLI